MINFNDRVSERLPMITDNLVWHYPLDGTLQCKVFSLKWLNILSVKNKAIQFNGLYDKFSSLEGNTITVIDSDLNDIIIPDTEKKIGKYNLMIVDAESKILSDVVIDIIKKYAKDYCIPTIVLGNRDQEYYNVSGTSCLFCTSIPPDDILLNYIEKGSRYRVNDSTILYDDYINIKKMLTLETKGNSTCSTFSFEFKINQTNGITAICGIESEPLAYFAVSYDLDKSEVTSYFLEESTQTKYIKLRKGFNSLIVIKKDNFISCFLNGKVIAEYPYERFIDITKFILGSPGSTLFASIPANILVKNASFYNTNLNSKQIRELSNGTVNMRGGPIWN